MHFIVKEHHLSEEDIQKRVEEMKKDLKEAVIKDIQIYLILEKISQMDPIPLG